MASMLSHQPQPCLLALTPVELSRHSLGDLSYESLFHPHGLSPAPPPCGISLLDDESLYVQFHSTLPSTQW